MGVQVTRRQEDTQLCYLRTRVTRETGRHTPFTPDGCENHFLPLIVQRDMKKGGMLLVQEDFSVVVQEHGNSLGVAFPCCKVERCVLLDKSRAHKWFECGKALCPCLVSLPNCLKDPSTKL